MVPLEVLGRRRHARDDLGLGAGDVLARAEEPDMRGADLGDDAVGRLGDARERLDLPRAVHAHLEHEHLRVGGRRENGERQADEAVEVALGGVHAVGRGEQVAQDLLRGGLAHRSCDAHDRAAHARAVTLREALEKDLGVVGAEHGALVLVGELDEAAARLFGENHAGSPGAHRLRREVVSVDLLARKGDEDAVALNGARVDHAPPADAFGVAGVRHHPRDRLEVLGCDLNHRYAEPLTGRGARAR